MKLIVFDGNSILNRAFFGVRPLTTKTGLFTNAVFGFVNILNKHLSASDYDCAAVAFDLKAPTFRHKMYDGYKATRHGMPDELAMQLDYAKNFCRLFGLTVVECEGYEADDVLGTLAARASALGGTTSLVTGDRDSYQLVSDNTTVILTSTNEDKVYTPERIKNEYGVTPYQLIDVKALMGDSSDNIPGVRGIGEKTALKLIAEYGSLDGVYENTDSIKGANRDKLINGKQDAYMSRELARIMVDVPTCTTPDKCARRKPDRQGLISLFTELEFFNMITRFGLDKPDEEDSQSPDEGIEYESIDASELLALARENEVFLSLDRDDGWLFVTCADRNLTLNLDSDIFDLFENGDYKVTVWSYKDLAHILDEDCRCEFNSLCDDVSLMAYIASPNDGGTDFRKSAATWLGISDAEAAPTLGKLRDRLLSQIKEIGCENLYRNLERPLAKVLFDMEKTGFSADGEGLLGYSEYLDSDIKILENSVFNMAGEVFNINSPRQLGTILFEKLGLPSGRKTKTGYSTDVDVLEQLRYASPIVDAVLEYRTLSKLKSTYADGLRNCIDPRDGRIHTTFRQTLTMTGRLSSIEPNLQNIPVKTELGRELRRFFLAGEGNVLIDCDYSQIELRVLADISGDEAMIKAFEDGDDIHTITASQVFGIPPEEVTPALRKRAKAVNFGIVYGISDYSLSRDIGVTKKEAARYIEGYFAHYPSVRKYLTETVEKAREDGYVTTKFGRRRSVPELKNSKKSIVAFGERVAMNTPIQGTAADIIKIAMCDTARALEESGTGAKLILQVHDELIVECPERESEKVAALLKEKMETCCKMRVPLLVDTGIGRTWFDSKA